MSTEPQQATMALIFERQGFFLTPRQMEFCRLFLKHQDAFKAARLAGYPDPKIQGEELYMMFRPAINAWIEYIDFDRQLVHGIYRRQAQSTFKNLTNSEEIMANPEAEPVYEELPDEGLQTKGAKGLRDLLGLDANKGLDINTNARVELPATLREKMDKVYVQGNAQ